MRVETCLQRVAALESALELQQGQAAQLVLRLPQLLLLQPSAVVDKVQQLLALLDGQLPAVRQLVLADPKVLKWLLGCLFLSACVVHMMSPGRTSSGCLFVRAVWW